MARVEQSIEVNVSPGTTWDALTRFEQYPRFMQGVEEVRITGDRRLRWHTRLGAVGMHWDAEITQQVPEQILAWRNLDGPRNEGRIALEPLAGGRTRVIMALERDASSVHAGSDPQQDLLRFKQFVENLGRENGDWQGRPQEGGPGGAAPSGYDAGMAGRPGPDGSLHALGSLPEQPDAPQQPYGADDADNAVAGAGKFDRRWMRARGLMPAGLRTRWQDPVAAVRRVSDNVEQIFTGLAQATGLMRGQDGAAGAWSPRIETVESPDRMLICVEVPGMARDEITVELRHGKLVIEGSRQPPANLAEQGNRCSEFRYGRFQRSIQLPIDADTAAASAELRHGVLQVTVLRTAAAAAAARIRISES